MNDQHRDNENERQQGPEREEELSATQKRAMMNDIFASIKTIKKDELPEDQAPANEESIGFPELLDHAVVDLDQQSLVQGRIISVTDREVMVDFGFKTEGIVPRHEFDGETPEVGDTIELFLERIEERVGQAVLSKRKAEFMKVWSTIKQKYTDGEIVEGIISRRTKGGMVVNILGIDAFLPGSQLDVRPIQDFDDFVGKSYEFKIVKVNEFRKNIVVSRKELLEESLKEQRRKLLEEIEVGQVLEGRVKHITDYGVFIDLGGIDGLLHISDLTWGHIGHPSEIVNLDEDIIVKILQYNSEEQRISLGLKQLSPDPWVSVHKNYSVGSEHRGKVIRIKQDEIRIELSQGVEGILSSEEVSADHMPTLGDSLELVISSVDMDNKLINLALKLPPPPEDFEALVKECISPKPDAGDIQSDRPEDLKTQETKDINEDEVPDYW